MSRMSWAAVAFIVSVACVSTTATTEPGPVAGVDSPPEPGSTPPQPAAPAVPEQLQAETGPLTLGPDSRRNVPMTWEDYRRFAERFADQPQWFREPPALAAGHPTARYGFNLVFDDTNHSYLLLPRDDGRATMYIDEDADGRVDDEQPVELHDAFVVHLLGRAQAPMSFWWGEGALEVRDRHDRDGVVRLGDHALPFRVLGRAGAFDTGSVVFDLDGDGAFDTAADGDERFTPTQGDPWLTFADAHWRISVVASGETLTLDRRDDVDGPRPSVAIGRRAPDFDLVVDDQPRSLSQLRGGVVLEFFAPGCAFCTEAAKPLREASRSLRAAGVTLVSIDTSGTDEAAAWAAEHGKDWPLVLGPPAERVAGLYRASAVPLYVLIDSDGTIVAKGNWRALGERITAGAPWSP